jgi:hypothetical protein
MDIKKYRRLIGLRDLPYEDLSAVCRDLFEELGKMLSIRLGWRRLFGYNLRRLHLRPTSFIGTAELNVFVDSQRIRGLRPNLRGHALDMRA